MTIAPEIFGGAVERYRQAALDLLPRLAAALVIALTTYVAAKLLSRAAERLIRRTRGERGGALAPIVRVTVVVVVGGLGAATSLGQLGVNVAALLAGAGVAGVAIGFGAQTLVKDCLTGFFLMLDDVLGEGDYVSIDGINGFVERVGLRVTQVRTYAGQLVYFPNGEIKRVGNWHRGWVRAIVEVAVAYEQDVKRGMSVLTDVGEAWAAEHPELVLEPPEVHGILGLNGSDVTIRLVVKMKNDGNDLWSTERELRKRTKEAFDRNGVEIPFARQVVYHRQEAGVGLRLEQTRETAANDARAS